MCHSPPPRQAAGQRRGPGVRDRAPSLHLFPWKAGSASRTPRMPCRRDIPAPSCGPGRDERPERRTRVQRASEPARGACARPGKAVSGPGLAPAPAPTARTAGPSSPCPGLNRPQGRTWQTPRRGAQKKSRPRDGCGPSPRRPLSTRSKGPRDLAGRRPRDRRSRRPARDYLLENWNRRRAPDCPYFFLSTIRGSRVRNPFARSGT